MSALLLAPYNDSMRLGQGFNSFLQSPRLYNVMEMEDLPSIQKPIVSQTVSYSSRIVTSISDVVGSMNISAGSSIKSGTILLAGNTQSIDTLKFKESDINAVVSVKVVNQTVRVKETSKMSSLFTTLAFRAKINEFTHKYHDLLDTFDDDNLEDLLDISEDEKIINRFFSEEIVRVRSEDFFESFGDCYISSFIDGGELHGIISIKVLDKSRVESTTSRIKSLFNNSDTSELVLTAGSNGSSNSPFKEALTGTEVTISVSWSGGGQIKPPSEEWSLDALLDAAAAFPANVAKHPYHTRAILTKYTTNAEFLELAKFAGIVLPDFANVQSYSADLLDMYVGYKANLAVIHDVLAKPAAYEVNPVVDAVDVNVKRLVEVRKAMKAQMALITQQIDDLNIAPGMLDKVEAGSGVESPELWAARLPVLKVVVQPESDKDAGPKTLQDLINMFPIKRQIKEDPTTKKVHELMHSVDKIIKKEIVATPLKGRLVPVDFAASLQYDNVYMPKKVPDGFATIGHTTASWRALVISAWSDQDATKMATGFDTGVTRGMFNGQELFARLPTCAEDEEYKALSGIATHTADFSKIAMVHKKYLTPLKGSDLKITQPKLLNIKVLPYKFAIPTHEQKIDSGVRYYNSCPWSMEPAENEPVLWMIKEEFITIIDHDE